MWPGVTELLDRLQNTSSSNLSASRNSKVSLSHRMDLSPLQLHDEAASQRSSTGLAATFGGLSPPLPSHRQSIDQPRRHKNDKHHHHTSCDSSLNPTMGSCSGGVPTSQASLPLLAGMMASRKELFTELAIPSTQSMNGQQQGQGTSSSLVDAAQPPTPQGRVGTASRALSPRALSTLGSLGPSGPVAGLLGTSPSGKDLPNAALRGGFLSESISLVESSVSSISRSALRLHRGRVRDRLPSDREDSSGMDGGRNDVPSQVQLPLITRSLTSACASLQGRQLPTTLQELEGSSAGVELPTLSCTFSLNSMPHEDEGPCLAPALKIVLEASAAVGQPPRPLHPADLPQSRDERCDVDSIKPSSSFALVQSAGRATVMDMGSDDDAKTREHRPTPIEISDRGGGTSMLATAPVSLTVEASPLTLAGGLTGQSSSQNSTGMAQTTCASTPASPFARNAAVTPIANSGFSRLDTAVLGGGDYVQEATRPPTGERSSGPKHGSLQSLDHDNYTTAARGATGQQRPSDSIENDDAAHQKRAKRRLKKTRKKGKAKRQKNDEAVAEGESGVAFDALKAVAVAHRSASALARKRQRKRQLKQEKMKEMSSEERRQYKAEHQRRRAAKKAMRSSAAAASPHLERGDHGDWSGSRPHHSSDPSASFSPAPVPAAGAVKHHPPLSSSPELPQPLAPVTAASADPAAKMTSSHARQSSTKSEVEQSVPNLVDRCSSEDLAATLSPQVLASTCSATTNALADGSSSSLKALQGRRCTSASGGGAPVVPSTTHPFKSMSSTPAPFRRRFFTDIAGRQQHQGGANSFLHESSSTPANVSGLEGQLQARKADAEGFGVERDATLGANGGSADNYDANESRGPPRRQPMDESGAVVGVVPEGAPMSDGSALSLAPHLPAAAAGSGTAAILELKQQQGVQQRHRLPSLAAGSSSLTAVFVSVANANGDVASADASNVSLMTASASECGADHCQGSSLPLRPDAEASQSVEPGLNQSPTGDALTGAVTKGTAAISVTSMSYCSAYSRSHTNDGVPEAVEPVAKGAGGAEGCGAGQNALTPVAAVSAAVAAARKARQSPSSSCSSLRSRSSDDESADGSTGYSYSSYSSSGSLVPEVLQLVGGCTVPPPVAAFSDLKYRCSCVPQLHSYAEPAIIHEWNLTEGCWGSVETSVVLSPQPFSKGNMRASYYMIDMRRLNCLLVAKRYLRSTVKDDQYFDDVSMHSIAGHWARVFNTMQPPKEVRFVPAAVLILPKRNPPLILAMEPQLTGKFVKYNNNCGYVRRKARWTPQAFSHFTYHASDHELMVVDIQGVDDYYTDPQILSSDGEGYGRGNLGEEGIRRFLESHKCNEVCRAVGLPPLQRNAKGAVIAPLASPGSGRSSAGPGTPAAKDRLNTAIPCAPGLKEERLPPKAFMHARRASSGNTPGHEHNGVQLGSRQPSEGALKLSPAPPPRQTLHTGSRPSSPSPLAAAPSALTPGPLPHRVGPVQNGGVKYVRYPRQALVRPQSQYFVSTVAGGLMSVPQQGSGVPNGCGNGSFFSALQSYPPASEQSGGKVGGSPTSGSAGAPSGMAGVGHASASPPPQGSVMVAVPLLRPPAGGRPGYAGAQSSVSPEGFHLLTAPRSGENVGSLHQTPHVRPSGTINLGGGVPNFYSHPPLTGAVGSPTGRCASHQSSFAAVASAIQATEEVAMAHRPRSRRQSFSRRPVFSAVEEMPKRSESRNHGHPHLH
ncbi:myosin heavy chain kinase c-like protein [Leishmania major strain Friedlin]|uniref:Myosin heavy chain kinase c-like protein n=1 Tax=Leishmania major TaxID=5664 RepID=Q4QA27_LEIMA|nr:myosin heavy chain kinase c-like protein [Leishmania major strain Friedlin]CAG9575078.1 myosin_heavy_chain_kinase_c-like_protein [Leishmania major strain Friedlin]CAJ04867.1 myosin heavy chain kinase c-like protein [Leishmania major strain Friedlin]|eukprot:XP_001683821.1 myosin heavy chain kinase c-like protein [Leishmania major strain Friedlin]